MRCELAWGGPARRSLAYLRLAAAVASALGTARRRSLEYLRLAAAVASALGTARRRSREYLRASHRGASLLGNGPAQRSWLQHDPTDHAPMGQIVQRLVYRAQRAQVQRYLGQLHALRQRDQFAQFVQPGYIGAGD